MILRLFRHGPLAFYALLLIAAAVVGLAARNTGGTVADTPPAAVAVSDAASPAERDAAAAIRSQMSTGTALFTNGPALAQWADQIAVTATSYTSQRAAVGPAGDPLAAAWADVAAAATDLAAAADGHSARLSLFARLGTAVDQLVAATSTPTATFGP